MPNINPLNHHEHLDRRRIHFVYIISFVMNFGSALFIYAVSSYFKEVLGTDNIGFIYTLAYLVILLLLLNLHKIIFVFGKAYVFHAVILIKIVALLGLLLFPISKAGIGFMILYLIAGFLSWAVLNSILESFSVDRQSGRIRGANLSISGAGFLMGPILSTQLFERYSFQGVFMATLIVLVFIFLISLVFIKSSNHKFTKKINVTDLLRKAIRRKDIMNIYYVSFALEFFYALMIIYVPLYLLGRGFTWEQLGVAFTIMLLPFVFVQYPIGLIADKKMGEKELLLFSFFILGISTVLMYMMDSKDIWVWTTLLLLGRIGAALVEILRESYFFKRIDGGDVDLIDFFGSASPVAFIVATLMSSVLLVHFPMRGIFIVVTIVLFSAMYPTFMLVDNRTSNKN